MGIRPRPVESVVSDALSIWKGRHVLVTGHTGFKGGWLALWWTHFGDPTRPDPFHDALQPVLGRLVPQLTSVAPAAAPDRDIEASGLFTGLQRHTVSWEGRHDPAGLRALFSTFSPWLALPEPQRTEALDAVERLAREAFGGIVVRPYQTVVHVAQRRTR